jgi:hypothetical protein
VTDQPPTFAQDIKVHAEAVVIRNGVPVDDDGNPLPGPDAPAATSTED